MRDNLSIAHDYVNRGMKVFPCHSVIEGRCTCNNVKCDNQGKHPLTANGVHDATDEPDKLTEYFSCNYSGANIAIATGECSGVWVVDVDNIDDLRRLEDQHGKLPRTPMAKTGSGFHYYFGYDDRCHQLKNAVKFAGGLDCRTTGGYCLAPPSSHLSGNQYHWIVSFDDCEPAPAPDWLIDLIPMHDQAANTTHATACVERSTHSTDGSSKTQTVRIGRATTISDRCWLYLKATPPAISGSGGHNHTFTVTCRIIELFGSLSDDELNECLDDWNQRCDPPWTDKELRHKINSARSRLDSKPVDSVSNNHECFPVLADVAYHGIAGEIIRVIEPNSECDPVALLVTLLTAIGNAIGRQPFFQTEQDRHYPNLFTILVGQSARARKGTSKGVVCSIMQNEQLNIRSGLSTGEGLIGHLRDDADQNTGKNVWVTESEFARCLTVMKRESNILSSVLRDAWDRGQMQTLTRHDPLMATDCHVSITAHITAAELQTTLKQVEIFNGFANRFLWFMVKRSKLLPNGGQEYDLQPFRDRLARVIGQARTIGRMSRSPDCRALWEDVYGSLTADKPTPVWDAVTSRAESQTVRLSMIFALLDGQSIIQVDHLRAALAIWHYADESARLLFSDSTGNKLEHDIVAFVSHHEGSTKTDIKQSVSHSIEKSVFDSALSSLVSRGRLVAVPVYDKRQAMIYYKGLGIGQQPTVAKQLIPNPGAVEIPADVSPADPMPAGSGSEQNGSGGTRGLLSNGATTPTATIAELVDWRNRYAVRFERTTEGRIWVSSQFESQLTPAIRNAIQQHQELVARFVESTQQPTSGGEDIPITDTDFYEELISMNDQSDDSWKDVSTWS